jgi:hypothetical protein
LSLLRPCMPIDYHNALCICRYLGASSSIFSMGQESWVCRRQYRVIVPIVISPDLASRICLFQHMLRLLVVDFAKGWTGRGHRSDLGVAMMAFAPARCCCAVSSTLPRRHSIQGTQTLRRSRHCMCLRSIMILLLPVTCGALTFMLPRRVKPRGCTGGRMSAPISS